MNSATAHDETDRASQPTNEPREQPLASLSDVERRHIERAMEVARWNQPRAAKMLGISRWSLARRVQKYGMHRPGRAPHA